MEWSELEKLFPQRELNRERRSELLDCFEQVFNKEFEFLSFCKNQTKSKEKS